MSQIIYARDDDRVGVLAAGMLAYVKIVERIARLEAKRDAVYRTLNQRA